MTRSRQFISQLMAVAALVTGVLNVSGVNFTNNARIEINDATNGLSLNPANNQFSISCWFRLSIPSTVSIQDHLIAVINRRVGSDTDHHAYQIRFNPFSGNIEFTARGASSGVTNALIQSPYVDRWYHVAITRDNNSYKGFLDGRKVFDSSANIGAILAPNGVTIGGLVNGKWFFGDVQEVAIYNVALSEQNVFDRMFQDQTGRPGLRGYYKLGYSTNASDLLRNFAASPPQGTDLATTNGSGFVEFEETDRAGEQSVFDSRKNNGDNALSPLGGAFSWEQTAFSRPTPGIAFELRLGYSTSINSGGSALGTLDPYVDPSFSVGWRHSFEARVLPDPNAVFSGEARVIQWNGAIETWVLTNGIYRTRHGEYRGELTNTSPNGIFEWTTPERLVYRFRPLSDGAALGGRLVEIRDYSGNRVQVNWDDQSGTISNIVDTAGGVYAFHHDGIRLTNVVFGSWQLKLSYDSTPRLISKSLTNTSGLYTNVNTTWQFQYGANGLLSRVIDPRSNSVIQVSYDQYGRQTNQVDALNRTNRTRYGVPGKRQIARIDPAGFQWIESYDRKGRIVVQQDPLTNSTSYTYDDFGNRTSITEPLGYKTTFGYDARANVTASTNELGQVTRWVFHPFYNKAVQQIDALGWTNFYAYDAAGNLTNHFDALGSLVRYSYSTNGLVLTSTDANGNLTSFGYNTNGFLISRTDPANNTNSLGLNDVGWKLTETNALGQIASYAYDLNGNVVRTLDPLFRSYVKTYDANGNLTSASDAKGAFSYHFYDPVNQRTQTVDRISATNRRFYTSRGSLDRVIDPIGNSIINLYDNANRLVTILDPLGQGVTNVYNANGNVVTNFDKLGRSWVKTYDRLNRVTAESDPLGNTKQTQYDELGRIFQVVTPNGFPSLHYYDGRGRLTNWLDAENFTWRYGYDGVGNITNITDALGGQYVMAYSNRNERILERNQDNKEWRYRYDKLLRLEQQTDPNGLVRTIIYDDVGRVDYVDFSTGRQDNYTYDENNNLTDLSRTKSPQTPVSSHFTFDANDRVSEYKEATFPINNTVKYGYDLLGRIATLTYPGNLTLTNKYDVLSRLTNQVDWAGRELTYAYDKANRLINRTYPNGVVQTNTFDDAGRITGLSHSPSTINSNTINIALNHAYDRNSNKTGSSEKGTFNWPQPSLHDETFTNTPAGRLISKTDSLSTSNNWTYFYDASGNMTNAANAGQSFLLTYDEDNRTTSMNWDFGMASKQVTNRYDALGRRISRKVDGAETRFVLDLAGSMERILCDATAGGQITAYYIHGPDLAYKVTPGATETITCYHSDAQANIIALTDGSGTNVAQYAYTPYGRSLGYQLSTNNNQLAANSYSFVGSQGVMNEFPDFIGTALDPSLYFMRARYYSADAGVFLSTDPVKNIGPTRRPAPYTYGGGNPLGGIDPDGRTFRSFVSKAKSTVKSAAKSAVSVSQKVVSGVSASAKAAVATASKAASSARGVIADAAMSGVKKRVDEVKKETQIAKKVLGAFSLSANGPQAKVANGYEASAGAITYSLNEGIKVEKYYSNQGASGTGVATPAASLSSVDLSAKIKKTTITASAGAGLPIPDFGFNDLYDPNKGVWTQELHFEVGDFGFQIEKDLSDYVDERQMYENQQRLEAIQNGDYEVY